MTRRSWALAAALLAAAFAPEAATAAESSVTATSDIQLYTAPNPWGTRELRRRRYTQTLGLTVADLVGGANDGGPDLTWSSRLRLDADLGQGNAVTDPTRGTEFVPGVSPAPVDLQYAYLDARGLVGEALAFRVGRQYVTGPLGWWSFDGARVTTTPLAPLGVSAYGGFEQRALVPLLATSRFTADGVFRGSRRDLEANQWPSYLSQRRPAPAFGFAVTSHALPWLDAELAYRRVQERDAAAVILFPDDRGALDVISRQRVSTERAGGAVVLTRDRLGSLAGRAAFDFLLGRWQEHGASVSWFAGDPATITLGYEYHLPTFDGDSIFNWFATEPMTNLELSADLVAARRLAVAPRVGARRYGLLTGDPDSDGATDATASVAVERWWTSGEASLDVGGDGGAEGHQLGADLKVTRRFLAGLYDTLVILSVHDWQDDAAPERDATSFSYVLGGGLHPAAASRLGIEWEHTTNRLVGQRYRILATLEVEVGP